MDFRSLASGTDFDLNEYQNALLVWRRAATTEASEGLVQLYSGLHLVGLDVTKGAYNDFVRVERSEYIDVAKVSREIQSQLQAAGFSVTNDYPQEK